MNEGGRSEGAATWSSKSKVKAGGDEEMIMILI